MSSLILSTYGKEGECLLVTLVALHLDVDIDRVLSKVNLCIILVLCENAQNDIGLSLVPISTAIDHFFSLNHTISLL